MKKLLILLCIVQAINSYSQPIDFTKIELSYYLNSSPRNLIKGDTKVYFTANDGINGKKLWVYDIFTEQITLLKSFCENCSSHHEFYDSDASFFTDGDILYFILGTSPHGLWRSDGTIEGTYQIKDFYTPYANITDYYFFKFNNLIFFHAYTQSLGYELWRTDGTEQGTFVLKNINNTNSVDVKITKPIILNNKFYFGANDGIYGENLWTSDGTEAGTYMVKDVNTVDGTGAVKNLFSFNNKIYFTAVSSSIEGNELWVSDGTSEGTHMLKNINANPYMSAFDPMFSSKDILIYGDHFYFYANNGINGSELWRSDGTEGGTQMFMDINPGPNSSSTKIQGILLDDYFLFASNQSYSGFHLWRSDGTVEGTELIKVFDATLQNIFGDFGFDPILLNNEIYFKGVEPSTGFELWKTDGTINGTTIVKDIFQGTNSSRIKDWKISDQYLYFRALDVSNNSGIFKVWRSNGTEQGTIKLSDKYTSNSTANEFEIISIGNSKVIFQAGSEYEDLNGNELYISDGTVENTVLLKDLNRSSSGGGISFIEFNGNTIFTGGYSMESYSVPIVTNGTLEGTRPLKSEEGYYSIPNNYITPIYTNVGNKVFFDAYKNGFGRELFVTDGTSDGTYFVKDIAPGQSSTFDHYTFFMEFNNILYFRANDQIHGNELWRSDGTEEGTYMVKDIFPGQDWSIYETNSITSSAIYNYNFYNFKGYAKLNNYLYFPAKDQEGPGIFRTDGTEQGTQKIIPILSTEDDTYGYRIINQTDHKMFFIGSNQANYNIKTLYSYDGIQDTPEVLLSALDSSYEFKKNIVLNNELYFVAHLNGLGRKLFKSDGTSSGTIILENIEGYERIQEFYVTEQYVYYITNNLSSNNNKMWRTDGTPGGAIVIEDFSSSVSNYFMSLSTSKDGVFYISNETSNSFLDENSFKIWYMNDTMEQPNYFELNFERGEDWLNYISIRRLYAQDDILYVVVSSDISGEELYAVDVNNYLDIKSIDLELVVNNNNFRIFPNPTKDEIFITSDNLNIDKVEIFDILGKSVLEKTVNNIQGSISLSGFTKGIYLVKLFSGADTKIFKIVLN